jgi:hypothetical protein
MPGQPIPTELLAAFNEVRSPLQHLLANHLGVIAQIDSRKRARAHSPRESESELPH